jgi:3-phenylpropionate/trans-cinnamate dioxygenase ferredoxin subunit
MTAERVCALSDLDDRKPVAVEVEEVPVVLVRDGDEVFALRDECSHAELPLSDGDVQPLRGGRLGIECFLHGSCFDLRTGAPSSLPATEPVDVFQVRLVDGEVHVDVHAPAST